ncbi:MAG: serine/threonine protein kinase [Planctomycetota bacterium]|jgi:serine/threonine protein kinase
MISSFASLLLALVSVVLVIAFPIAAIYLIFKLVSALCLLIWHVVSGLLRGIGYGFKGIGMGASHIYAFARNTVVDALRMVGAALTSVFMVPPILGNVALGRWSAANHYGRAFEREIKESWVRLYRLVIGNPIRLVGLRALTEGVEERLPEVLAQAPGADRPRGGKDRFPGYRVTGSLPRGGSGARLYLAEPTRKKYDHFAKNNMVCPGEVVIKAFSLEDGSTLPQIVRESRALTAAKELGLVLDHTLQGENFWYVMPFVEGKDLSIVSREWHLASGDEGLDVKCMREMLQTTAQLLATLDGFHSAGLWHKDIKPANVIVSTSNQAHLVDFGLVTPLQSAMTLTTHGTEYFRDPEMVRLAMRGVKVHEVDGVKFDLYSMGAMLFSMIENSFPAHGNLSQISKQCPEALRWVVRRSMADTKSRYASSREMLADVATILESGDPFEVTPADLPSFNGQSDLASSIDPQQFQQRRPAAGNPAPLRTPSPEATPKVSKKRPRHVLRGVAAAFIIAFGIARWEYHLDAERASERRSAQVEAAYQTPVERGLDHAEDVINHAMNVINGTSSAQMTNQCEPRPHKGHVHHDENCTGHVADQFALETSFLSNAIPTSSVPYDVLIINDLSPAVSEEYLLAINEVLVDANMQARGLASDDEREIEWLAQARKAGGINFPANPRDTSHLEQFLNSNQVLDAVWWLMDGDQDGQLVSKFVTANGPVGLTETTANMR